MRAAAHSEHRGDRGGGRQRHAEHQDVRDRRLHAGRAGAGDDEPATAGGTQQAFVITTNQNVAQQFQQALDTIRGASLPCDYQLPVPESGTPDYTKVNVQYTSGGGNVSVIPYVTNAQGCDPQAGGWYYDVDPAGGAIPSKVVTCPATCNTIKADPGGKIDIVQGCKTIVK
jgi:hypothetical protein